LSRAFVLVVALCAAGGAAAAKANRLDTLRIEGKTLTTEVARANGFFAKHGIDVRISSSPNSEVMRQKLSSGAVDIIDDGLDNAVKMKLDGTDVVILTGSRLAQQELIGQLGIKSAADVRGKSVIVDVPDTQAALLLKKILLLGGLKAGVDYRLVPLGMNRFAAMQSNREYAAAMMSGPEAVIAKRMGFTSLGRSSELIGPILYHGSYARRDWAVAHKDLVERYVAANIEAQRWLLAPSNEAKVVEMIQAAGPGQLSAAEAKKVYGQLVSGPEALTKDLRFDVEAFRNFLRVRSEVERSWRNGAPPPEAFFDDSYYRDAAAKLPK
jgi:ABC-type nitrate/sulfonate/bicarbonate transport system substrate-binding protein